MPQQSAVTTNDVAYHLSSALETYAPEIWSGVQVYAPDSRHVKVTALKVQESMSIHDCLDHLQAAVVQDLEQVVLNMGWFLVSDLGYVVRDGSLQVLCEVEPYRYAMGD